MYYLLSVYSCFCVRTKGSQAVFEFNRTREFQRKSKKFTRRLLIKCIHIIRYKYIVRNKNGHQRSVKTIGRAIPGVLHGEKVPIVFGPENSHRRVHAHLSVSGEYQIFRIFKKFVSHRQSAPRYASLFHPTSSLRTHLTRYLLFSRFLHRWLSVALGRVS